MQKRKNIKEVRKKELIEATLKVIEHVGIADASIMLIAKEANLSTGIIHHYFGDKNGLLVEAMQYIMQDIGHEMTVRRKVLERKKLDTPYSLIKVIIDSNLNNHQTRPIYSKTWLAFWNISMHQAQLQRLNKINKKRLYSNLLYQFARELPKEKAKLAATGFAALIEGLWLQIALFEDKNSIIQARKVAYYFLDQHLKQ